MVTKLIEILQAEYQIYQELYRLSEEKQEIIIDNRVEDLLEIIEEEQKEVQKIDQLEGKRIDILEKIAAKNSLQEGELSFDKLIELISEPQKSQLQEIRSDILELLEELQEINEINANLIRESLQLTDYTLELLTNSNIGKTNTYQKPGDKGQDSSDQQRRIIDQKV
ncbi:flagellar protein FlgN [Acetohalobium arabaticum]|uniref:FlgN family protein n=1 Tax=Acetohalobium arabaticum (strain ATCC 49924 / DSM 5501 / Z-7288) TaxID=574087 RepID=D9QTN2_ACEAZ|nr:flagellar protein FlgN [Acetohalobium arabaticum]ADL11796.1 FlgN family protein [Acetohalobium arabaticum DSM 5501]